MKRPNYTWDPMCCLYRYPSGHIAVTEQEMYADLDAMRYWGAVAFLAALAWLVWGGR